MRKYFVTMEEIVHYTVEVDAENAEEAAVLAAELWAQSENPDADFIGEGLGSEAINVEPAA